MNADLVVHVIDDDDAVRDSLGFLLGSAGLKHRTYESGTAFLAALPQSGQGCVITDVRMPGIGGIDLLREIKTRRLPLPVIVMTGHGDIALAVEAMKAGAVDFVEKPFDDDSLLATVRAALGVAEKTTRAHADRAQINSRLALLSERERQVLDGLIVGKANKVIAFELGISPRTVEIYRANLMTKTQANSLSDLVRMAITAGLFDR